MSSQSPSSTSGLHDAGAAPDDDAVSLGARCAVNAILIGADRDLSARVFAGFALPWRAEPLTVHRPEDADAACSWLHTVVEPAETGGLRFPCGLLHLWRSDLFQQNVMLMGSCQVTVVAVGVDEDGLNAGRRLLEELRAIRPEGAVLVAAVHEGGVLAPEPADIVELLGEAGAHLGLDVVTLQRGSRLDTHRLAQSLRLAARRSLERSWQLADTLDWSASAPRPAWFTTLTDLTATEPIEPVEQADQVEQAEPAEPAAAASPTTGADTDSATVVALAARLVQTPEPNAAMVEPASGVASEERDRSPKAGAAGAAPARIARGAPVGSGFRREVVVETSSPVPDYNPPNMTAHMAASIAAAIQINAGEQEAANAKPANPNKTATATTAKTDTAKRPGAAGEKVPKQPFGEAAEPEADRSAGPEQAGKATPRKRGLLRSALRI